MEEARLVVLRLFGVSIECGDLALVLLIKVDDSDTLRKLSNPNT